MTTVLEFLLSLSAVAAVVLLVSQQAVGLGRTAVLENVAEKLRAWEAVAECNLLYFTPSLGAREAAFSDSLLPALEKHCLAGVRLTAGGVLVVERWDGA